MEFVQVKRFRSAVNQWFHAKTNTGSQTPALKSVAYVSEPLEQRRLLSLTVPAYNSLPGAPKTIYLDFLGAPAFTWNNNDGHGDYAVHGPGGAGTAIPAFSIDRDTTSFSTDDLTGIQLLWARVAEKYTPFNVNVTTVDPGTYADNKAVECIVGGSKNDWFKQDNSGVSAIGGFTSSTLPNVCFAWSYDLAGYYDAPTIADAYGNVAAHEVGHELGLVHERAQGTSVEYYAGSSTQSPIMGAGSLNSTTRSIWWKTNAVTSGQNSTDPVQDELSILYSVLGTRADDQATSGIPTLFLSGDGEFSSGSGIIEQASDTDGFIFTPTASRVTFSVNDSSTGGMLAPNASIVRQSDGVVMPSTLTVTNTSCSISSSALSPNTAYKLIVRNDNTYSSLGQYSITGSQQQFATYDPTYRFVNVGGLDGDNNISLTVVPSNPTSATDAGQLAVSDTINGATTTQYFQMAGLNLVNITLGSGNDVVQVASLAGLNGSSAHPGVRFDGGGGSNELIVAKLLSSSDTFSVNSSVEVSLGSTDVTFKNVVAVKLNGNGASTFYVNDWQSNVYLILNGGPDADLFALQPAVMAEVGTEVSIDGGGGTNTLTINAPTSVSGLNYTAYDENLDAAFSAPSGEGGGTTTLHRDIDYFNLQSINVYGSSVADTARVDSLYSTTTFNFHGGDGNDSLTVGDPSGGATGSPIAGASVAGPVYFYGDGGTNYGYLDDTASTVAHTYVADHTHIGTTVGGNLFNPNDSVQFLIINGSSIGSTYSIYEGQPGVTLSLNGGAGADSFNFSNATTWNSVVYGNGGLNSLTVDDRSGAAAPYRTDIRDQSVTHFYGTASSNTSYAIGFNNIGSASYYAAPTTTQVNIFSTSANIAAGYQWTVVMNTGNDTINVYPHNTATGAATLLGPIGVIGGGGTDVINIDDSADPTAVSYDFFNQYNNQTANISGIGAGLGVAYDVETISVLGGAGNDSYRIDTFETGNALTINGNGGNDTCDIAPASKEISGSITSISSFAFNGGAGTDALNVHNENSSVAWSYSQSSTSIVASKAGYGLTMSNSGVETFSIAAGSAADSFQIQNASATATTVAGGVGLNSVIVLSGGNVLFATSQTLSTLALDTTASVAAVSNGNIVVRTNALSIGSGAKLDLSNNALIYDYTGSSPATTIRSYLIAGRNGGAWNGTSGINSSSVAGVANSAIGYGEASSILGASGGTFAGQTVDATALLLRFTLLGDANLDRKVDVVDLGSLSSNWQKAGGWVQGDFNYDNIVDVVDLGSLSSDWQKSYTPPVSPTITLPIVVAPIKKTVATTSLKSTVLA